MLPARLLVEVGFRAPKKLAGFTILQLAFVFCSARGVQRNLASSEDYITETSNSGPLPGI